MSINGDKMCETGFAKINLSLEILGKRDDGYHELRSLVCFARFGDELRLEPGPGFDLMVSGPFADAIEGENLLRQIANEMMAQRGIADFGRLQLIKNLPVAAGLGGGSADAGALLRLFARLDGAPFDEGEIEGFGKRFGADVPVCVWSKSAFMTGIGEISTRVSSMPNFGILLVNPGVRLATAAVFKALGAKPLSERSLASSGKGAGAGPLGFGNFEDVLNYMAANGNDFVETAISLAPVIGQVLDEIKALPGCRAAQLSGSGATCYGLFESVEAAEVAQGLLIKAAPSWWVVVSAVQGGTRSVRG